MSTTDIALTAHLLMPGGHPGDSFVMHIAEELRTHHGIGHVTLQIKRILQQPVLLNLITSSERHETPSNNGIRTIQKRSAKFFTTR